MSISCGFRSTGRGGVVGPGRASDRHDSRGRGGRPWSAPLGIAKGRPAWRRGQVETVVQASRNSGRLLSRITRPVSGPWSGGRFFVAFSRGNPAARAKPLNPVGAAARLVARWVQHEFVFERSSLFSRAGSRFGRSSCSAHLVEGTPTGKAGSRFSGGPPTLDPGAWQGRRPGTARPRSTSSLLFERDAAIEEIRPRNRSSARQAGGSARRRRRPAPV